MSPALPWSGYLEHARAESARFAEVLAGCDPAAPVPSCPDWTAADLLWHLTEVQRFWHHVVTARPAPPDGYREPERPASYSSLLEGFSETSGRFLDALGAADPDEAAWSWAGEDRQTVGFSYRRQAHEALIHRLDAEQAARTPTALPPELAADGVHEVLDVVYGGQPPWGRFDPLPHFVEFRMPDVGQSVWAQIGTFSGTAPDGTVREGERDQHVVPDPGVPADLLVTGAAGALDGWLWHRSTAGVTVEGTPAVEEHVMAVLRQPVD